MNDLIKGAEAISLFCRVNMNTKRDLPIRPSEMGLLILLVQGEGSHTPIEIADFFKVSKPMVTVMINSLLKKEYIIKKQSTSDKRSYELIPSGKAEELVKQTYDEYYKNMQILKEQLGIQEYERLIDLLIKANHILLEERKNG